MVAMSVPAIVQILLHFLKFTKFTGISRILKNVTVIVFYMVLPATVLVINVTVVCAVRRASNNAAANLGQQSTSSSSAVPNVMLVNTSLVYVLLSGTYGVVHVVWPMTPLSPVMTQLYTVTFTLLQLVYAYNFCVYLITGKQFRLELRKLFHCCTPHRAAETADDDAALRVTQPTRDQADTNV